MNRYSWIKSLLAGMPRLHDDGDFYAYKKVSKEEAKKWKADNPDAWWKYSGVRNLLVGSPHLRDDGDLYGYKKVSREEARKCVEDADPSPNAWKNFLARMRARQLREKN